MGALILGACARHSVQVPFKNGGFDTKGSPDEVVQAAYVEGSAYALTVDGRLRQWEIATGLLRDVAGPRVSRIAPDGSVAVSPSWSGDKVATITIRELPSGRTIAERRFEHGASVKAVSRSLAVLAVGLEVNPRDAAMQILPPTEEFVLWDLGRNQFVPWHLGMSCKHGLTEVSADGARVLCGSGPGETPILYDRALLRFLYPPALAPDWTTEARNNAVKAKAAPSARSAAWSPRRGSFRRCLASTATCT